MKPRCRCLRRLLLLASCASISAFAQEVRLDFEPETQQNWNFYVPGESKGAGCEATVDSQIVHQGNGAIRLHAQKVARFGVLPRGAKTAVKTGERYRLSVWIRVGDDYRKDPASPGVVVRLTLFGADGKAHPGGHLFVVPGNTVERAPVSFDHAPIPAGQWIELSGECTIPAGVTSVLPFVFVWRGSGTIWLDDFSLEHRAE